MCKAKKPVKKNPIAKILGAKLFRQRIVDLKTIYTRKNAKKTVDY
jgi:stalled ribosome alternative rescue factor ArfA